MRILTLDSACFSKNTEPAYVLLEMRRADIEAHRTGAAISGLLRLTDTLESALLYRNRLLFRVEGYDLEKTNLFEIAEARIFFGSLVQEWPFWLWFLLPDDALLHTFLGCLCTTTVHRHSPEELELIYEDKREIDALIDDLHMRSMPALLALGVDVDTLAGSIDGFPFDD